MNLNTTMSAPWRALRWVAREYWGFRHVDGVPYPPAISGVTTGFIAGALYGVYIWARDGNPGVALVFTTVVMLCALGDRRAQNMYAEGLRLGGALALTQVIADHVAVQGDEMTRPDGGDHL
jgi:4-amino-4-deoxy-L-arabinose transferase-like glycosyltransferase